MARRLDPVLDRAGRIVAAVEHVLGAGAGRSALLEEAVVVHVLAPSHVLGMRLGELDHFRINPQLGESIAAAEFVECRGFLRNGGGSRRATVQLQQQREAFEHEYPQPRTQRCKPPILRDRLLARGKYAKFPPPLNNPSN
jgi:hypothetical protein